MCGLTKLKKKLYIKNLKDFCAKYKYIVFYHSSLPGVCVHSSTLGRKKTQMHLPSGVDGTGVLYLNHKVTLFAPDTEGRHHSLTLREGTPRTKLLSIESTKKKNRGVSGLMLGYTNLENMQECVAKLRLHANLKNKPKEWSPLVMENPAQLSATFAEKSVDLRGQGETSMVCLGALCDNQYMDAIDCLRLSRIHEPSLKASLVGMLNQGVIHLINVMLSPQRQMGACLLSSRKS